MVSLQCALAKAKVKNIMSISHLERFEFRYFISWWWTCNIFRVVCAASPVMIVLHKCVLLEAHKAVPPMQFQPMTIIFTLVCCVTAKKSKCIQRNEATVTEMPPSYWSIFSLENVLNHEHFYNLELKWENAGFSNIKKLNYKDFFFSDF